METLETLQEKREMVTQRILKFEEDLKQPMRRDLDDNAVEEASREILYGLYKIEKANLVQIEEDLKELV